jgi:hypothetical protein
MREHIIVLQKKDKQALGAVRCLSGLLAAVEYDLIWVRGIFAAGDADKKIRQLPAIRSFTLDEQESLFPVGSLTPVGKLREMDWEPLEDFIGLEIPTSAMPGQVTEKYWPGLIASSRVAEGNALLTSLDVWRSYAETAPQARLEKIRFAASANKQVILLGTPLPPVPGKEYWMNNNILLPSGLDFEIPVVSALIAKKFNPANDHILLFDDDGSWDKIAADSFVPVTRSAVRLTE